MSCEGSKGATATPDSSQLKTPRIAKACKRLRAMLQAASSTLRAE